MANPNEKTVSIRAKLKFPDVSTFVLRYAPNISSAGFFLKTPSPKPVGTRVKFELLLADGSAVMRGLGQVSWLREVEEGPRAAGMGIKFVQLDDASSEVVSRILAHKRSAGTAPSQSRYSEVPPPLAPAPVEIRAEEPAAPPIDPEPAPAPPAPLAKDSITPAPAVNEAAPSRAPEHAAARRHKPRAHDVDLSAIDSMLADLAAPTDTAGAPRKRRFSRDAASAAPASIAPVPVPEPEPVPAPEPVPEPESASEPEPEPTPEPAVEATATSPVAPPEIEPEKWERAEEQPRQERPSFAEEELGAADLADLLEPDEMLEDDTVAEGARSISFMPERPAESLDDAFASVIDSVPPDEPSAIALGAPLAEDEEEITELGEDAIISIPRDEVEIALDGLDEMFDEADTEGLLVDLPNEGGER